MGSSSGPIVSTGARQVVEHAPEAQVVAQREPTRRAPGPGSAGPTLAPQPVTKDIRLRAAQNEANKTFDEAQKVAQQAQKDFYDANRSYNVVAAKLAHMKKSDPGRDQAIIDVSQKADKLQKAAQAQFDACDKAQQAAQQTGDQKKINAANDAYGKAKIQLSTAERVVKMVSDEQINAVLARMGLSTTSQGGASSNTGVSPQNKIHQLPSADQRDDTIRKAAESAVTHAKETEKKLFDAFDELDNALNDLQDARNDKRNGNRQVNVDKQWNDAKDQVREAAKVLETAANENVEAWKQASDATNKEGLLYHELDQAYAVTKAIVDGHTKYSSQYRDAALQRSKAAIEETQ